ncbi:hypothetical protein AB9F35_36200, partial [Rhizobium leguminosarum]|uniref:hypothetical protein n=1 Tax=Rhizobium leguminosarum TaxID=384 RepID=UPI003F9E9513
MSGTHEPVDLTNCDREPIHQLGSVQPFGFLMAVSSDWIVKTIHEKPHGALRA